MKLRTRLIQLLIEVNENIFFYPKLKTFYSSLFKNKIPTIIDVGCNKGQTIDFFLKINNESKIHGFEPNSTLFNRLQKKYSNNPRILLKNIGVSDKIGKLLFYQNVLDETSSFEKLNLESNYLKKKAKILGVSVNKIIEDNYEVDVVTLSDFIEKNINTNIDLIKIDVEGHELACLIGLFNAKKHNIKFIQLESHNDDMYLNNDNDKKIKDLLNLNGFKEIKKIKHGFGDFNELIYENTELI